MTEIEEPQFQTLAERIAALNRQKNFQAPEGKAKRAPPPPPTRPNGDARSQTVPAVPTTKTATNGSHDHQRSPAMPPRPSRPAARDAAAPPLPRRTTGASLNEGAAAAATNSSSPSPSLPSRIAPPPFPSSHANPDQPSPALPPRRPSSHLGQDLDVRRRSTASEISQISTLSALSLNSAATSVNSAADGAAARKLPPAFDQASLPPLPPTKRELEARAKEEAAAEAARSPPALPSRTNSVPRPQPEPASRPSLPPRLPSRPARSPVSPQPETMPAIPPRRLPPPPVTYAKTPPVTNGHDSRRPPIPAGSRDSQDTPPPVPLASRPTMAQINAASARAVTAQQNACLICRDFSAPDKVASQYPRQSLPRSDPVGYLAHHLCSPFASATDKARAIFTWFHYNIAYDVPSFVNGNIQFRDGEATIRSGVAVCSGYAETYKEIATRAGMECVVVTGHGKGAGWADLKKGQAVPTNIDRCNHAWSAVRIDGGEWKLLDACWGAGNTCLREQKFTPAFKPHEFTASNETVGMRHYPQESRYLFREDGRVPTWEEYIIGPHPGEGPTVYGDASDEGIDQYSIGPHDKEIPVYSGDEVVRFQFSKVCRHWTSEKNGKGKPALFLLSFNGLDGRKDQRVPLETDGFWHWIDVRARDLGAPGQTVSVVCLTQFDGRDARGVTAREFKAKDGRVAMGWSGLAKWDLV